MKKILCMILAAALFVLPVCAACADEVPQPEAGKKFDTDWALFGMTVSIVYEEEGYRVDIRSFDPGEGKGTVWEYACRYSEEKDVLESVVSTKFAFSVNAEGVEELAISNMTISTAKTRSPYSRSTKTGSSPGRMAAGMTAPIWNSMISAGSTAPGSTRSRTSGWRSPGATARTTTDTTCSSIPKAMKAFPTSS